MSLKGKIAVVTGGIRDIGRAIALKLANEGAKVAINHLNNETNAQETLKEIKAMGGEGIIVKDGMSLLEKNWETLPLV
ncbi:SDR family NAD(P)-dependent oxidoreductase [Kriegella aquimaris]|uniref:SDR family NAD(P)-dependent oxidoreductase n=1 Tax=Kriegella aquimaris TaxID=192904 RepID=UPI000B7F383A|nr:SDR family NAD(P)-dependent oxidoreductase [Kriegella aquimaris]